MINLLPPPVKEDMRYARLNAWLLGYVKLIVIVLIVLGIVFGGTDVYIQRQIGNIKQQTASRQLEIDSYKSLQAKAKQANSRLEAIKTLNTSKTHFSNLLSALAQVTPQGVALQSLTLSGSSAQPVLISFTASSYQIAVAFRDALASSPIISGADIQSVTSTNTGSFSGAITVGFKPGAVQ